MFRRSSRWHLEMTQPIPKIGLSFRMQTEEHQVTLNNGKFTEEEINQD